jgi:hypothetical protein
MHSNKQYMELLRIYCLAVVTFEKGNPESMRIR